jgi:hypothetical protein
MRGHPALDSVRESIVRFDLDVLLHRYRVETDTGGTRDIQCMMFIEVKTRGANVSPAQRDTLSLLNQVMRNRRGNRHQRKPGRHATDHVPLCKAYSMKLRRRIKLWMFGGHLLRMSGVDPATSDWMTWDNRPIDVEMLVFLLRFERDADTLRPRDWRRRSYTLLRLEAKGPLLPGINAIEASVYP